MGKEHRMEANGARAQADREELVKRLSPAIPRGGRVEPLKGLLQDSNQTCNEPITELLFRAG